MEHTGVARKKKGERKRGRCRKRGKKKASARAELITHFRLLKSERVRGRTAGLGVPIDANIDLYACGETDRGRRRGKSLFRIAGMNIYDRTGGRTRSAGGEKDTAVKKRRPGFRTWGPPII